MLPMIDGDRNSLTKTLSPVSDLSGRMNRLFVAQLAAILRIDKTVHVAVSYLRKELAE
jgi:hypothetical protein